MSQRARVDVPMGGTDRDFELVARWAAGDGEAGNTLVRLHYHSVFRFFELRIPRAAEDLTQRTFLACVESLRRRSLHTSFRSYLFGIARNHMLMHLRAARTEELKSFASAGERSSHKTSLTAVFARCEEQQLLLQAMVALPPDSQIAMQLFYWDGLTAAEIGEVVDAPTSTVTTRLSRARERIRRHLEALAVDPALRASITQNLPHWTQSLVLPGA